MHSSHLQVRWVYISNNGNGAISVCSVDASTGALSACTNTSSLFGGRGGVEFNATGKLAYFPSFNTEIVYQCNVNSSTGLLSGCVNSGGATFANPSGLAFIKVVGCLVLVAIGLLCPIMVSGLFFLPMGRTRQQRK